MLFLPTFMASLCSSTMAVDNKTTPEPKRQCAKGFERDISFGVNAQFTMDHLQNVRFGTALTR